MKKSIKSILVAGAFALSFSGQLFAKPDVSLEGLNPEEIARYNSGCAHMALKANNVLLAKEHYILAQRNLTDAEIALTMKKFDKVLVTKIKRLGNNHMQTYEQINYAASVWYDDNCPRLLK